MSGIPLYTEINDLHHLTGSAIRARHPLFHCFRMEDANDVQVEAVPPHRVSFYTLALSKGTRDLNFQINTDTFEKPSDFCIKRKHADFNISEYWWDLGHRSGLT